MTDGRTETPEKAGSAPRVGWSFLRSRRWVGYFTMLMIFSIACVLLGNWQFERRAEARDEITRIDNNYGAAATPLATEVPDRSAFDEHTQKWRTVVVNGTYVGEPFLARNRPGPEGVGSNLIQGFRTTTGEVFFVDRGWLKIDGADAATVSPDSLPAPANGPIELEARLRASEPEIAGRTSEGLTVASIDLPELARLTGTEDNAYTAAYGMLVSETPEGEHGELPAKPERDEGPHLSYALQWYVFIVIAAIGVVYAARREFRSLNRGSEEVLDHERRRAKRRDRRGPSDAEEEDALLDTRM